MTYKQRETMRELRLWMGQIVIPALAVIATVAGVPEVREPFVENVKRIKSNIFSKHQEEP